MGWVFLGVQFNILRQKERCCGFCQAIGKLSLNCDSVTGIREINTIVIFQVSSSNKKAFVVKFDFVGSNGVYHAIDQVL